MTQSELHQRILHSTLSNYIRTAVAMVVGLLSFRMLYQAFDKEEFGFWSLLWSVFGYGILLDFGFGFAAQKRVAELSVRGDWPQLSRVLSSILCFYSFIAVMLASGAYLMSPWLVERLGISGVRKEEFTWVMVIFFAGIGLAFPMGIFPEILRGQQRISLANWLITAALIARLLLLMAALHWDWGFTAIMLIALGTSLAPDLLAGFLALKSMPQVRISLLQFRFASMADTAKFSLFAYLSTATNLLMAKTDQVVITATLGVAAIVIYQSGAKISEIFRDFTRQLQDSLSPAAARLHAGGDQTHIRELLLNGTRWSVMIAAPLYLLCAFHLPELLALLTGEGTASFETLVSGQLLLLWHFSSVMTHSVSKRIFIMTGHERRLLWLGLGEAFANVALSVMLILCWRSVIAVAVGSLVPTLVFGWFYLWPWTAKEAQMSAWRLLSETVLPACLACLPAAILLVGLRGFNVAHWGHPTILLFAEGLIVSVVAAVGIWRFAMQRSEREHVLFVLSRRTAPCPL